eukprot:scaffold28756_cov59-Phaeocystis_antarctica.AAC.7
MLHACRRRAIGCLPLALPGGRRVRRRGGWRAWLASAAGGGAQPPECVVDQRGASGTDAGDPLRILGGPGIQ